MSALTGNLIENLGMEWNWNYLLLSILFTLMSLILWNFMRKNSYRSSKIPPGPRGWPLIGNIFELGTSPHRGLETLKQQYGPVVWLNLGLAKVMVILSAEAAEEFFKNHDLLFVDRVITDSMRSHDFENSSAASGTYWRTLRRLCTVEIFSTKRINETALVRQKCVDDMLYWIEKEVEKGATGGIEVARFVFPAVFNLIAYLTLSRYLMEPYSEMASEFHAILSGFTEAIIRPNVSDIFPWLSWLDLQGLRRKMHRDMGKGINFFLKFVSERVEQRQHGEGRATKHKDFLDVMLDFEGNGKDEPAKLSHHQISMFFMELFIAGTETTTATTEWAMSQLLQNPECMKKIKAELDTVVGKNKKLKESDIDHMPYLKATVEETLRLHVPLPILLRKASQDTNFMGYSIPKDTKVFINAWAIARDEENWEDALSFKPERFLESNIGFKGKKYGCLPFGAGRRICPGLPLAYRGVPLILGSLLHHFEWEVCQNASGEMKIDMMEAMGLAARKLKPLLAIPKRMTF